jgi:alpha-glucosidase
MIADPIYERTGHAVRGRDGCRVPLPWQPDEPGFGFGPPGGAPPWLPQPSGWRELAADLQAADASSMLSLYRAALRIKRARSYFATDDFAWIDAQADVLAFRRSDGFSCVINLSAQAGSLPAYDELLLASDPLEDGLLPPDTAVWLRTASD